MVESKQKRWFYTASAYRITENKQEDSCREKLMEELQLFPFISIPREILSLVHLNCQSKSRGKCNEITRSVFSLIALSLSSGKSL